jgi:hypothetical protein
VNVLTPLPLPAALPLWGLASLKVTRPVLRALLGEPHVVETDPRRTCGGEEDAWGYVLPSGQRLLVVLDVTTAQAELYGDPPDLGPVLRALRIWPDDPRLTRHARPWALT